MYCINCGEKINDEELSCSKCGTEVIKKEVPIETEKALESDDIIFEKSLQKKSYDNVSKGMMFLGILLPPVGIIYYFLTKKYTPNRAKSTLKGSITGIIVYVVAIVSFIYLIEPLLNKIAFKYACEKNTPGAVYDLKDDKCIYPDGHEQQFLIK